jgi:hypothetical protein
MIFIPRHRFNTKLVVVSGMGFDSHGEMTYSGSTPVSGTGYLRSTDEFAVTNAGIATITRNELFTSPELHTGVGDRVQVMSGPTTISGLSYRVITVRNIVDVDGFEGLRISQLTELEV